MLNYFWRIKKILYICTPKTKETMFHLNGSLAQLV